MALEKPTGLARFKAEFRKAAKWRRSKPRARHAAGGDQLGRFQDLPLLATTPFHRFGVNVKVKDEIKRDRRVHRDEEQRLLAACLTMNTAEHKWSARSPDWSAIKTTQRYLNITDEELRKALTGVWERRRQLLAVEPVAKVG